MADATDVYAVKPVAGPIHCSIEVPGSKSIANRALLLACMARGGSVLSNVPFGDDTRAFMECLAALGYSVEVDAPSKTVAVSGGTPRSGATIHTRSAGTAARFLTALLAAHPGEYEIDSSEQMRARPMKPLLDVLSKWGCHIAHSGADGFLPFRLRGKRLPGGHAELDASVSSQFTSALLMTGCLHETDLRLRIAGKETSRSYIAMTSRMMADFGLRVGMDGDRAYTVPGARAYTPAMYAIEPDVSSACYFYAAAALTGGSALVKGVRATSMQGDLRFLDILAEMGCVLHETPEGLRLQGPSSGGCRGVDVDMNGCSDQAITLAALAPFASSPTTIRNIGHIRKQETDRMHAISAEMANMGIRCDATDDRITIYPGAPRPSLVQTYGDHRVAMGFSLVGLRSKGIRIAHPACVSKTFVDYFALFDTLGEPLRT